MSENQVSANRQNTMYEINPSTTVGIQENTKRKDKPESIGYRHATIISERRIQCTDRRNIVSLYTKNPDPKKNESSKRPFHSPKVGFSLR